jgi:hypothetical protein
LTVVPPTLESVTTTATHSLLDGLNPQQRAAVTHAGGPLLIVAGAGSGKTRVLTHRIAYLLAERDVAPGEILAITFTNKAAGEMAARVAALVGDRRARAMWVMTFHSACVRILRREAGRFGYPSNFSIYDSADSQRLMALVCRELELDAKQYPPKAMAAQVSNLKNELDRLRVVRGQGPRRQGEGAGRGLRGVPAPPGRGGRDGLRRPDHGHGQPVPGLPRGRRGLPPPVPARARRRVPGHQPRAVRPGPRAGLRRRRSFRVSPTVRGGG